MTRKANPKNSRPHFVFAITDSENNHVFYGFTSQHPQKRYCDLRNSSRASGTNMFETPLSAWFREQHAAFKMTNYVVLSEVENKDAAVNQVMYLIGMNPTCLNQFHRQMVAA